MCHDDKWGMYLAEFYEESQRLKYNYNDLDHHIFGGGDENERISIYKDQQSCHESESLQHRSTG